LISMMGSLLPLCLEGMFLNKCQLILMRATSSLLLYSLTLEND
jgi:hypothetical protein